MSPQPFIEVVVTIAHVRLGSEELVYRPPGTLAEIVSDVEKLHTAMGLVLVDRDGRGYQFLTVFGAGIKPAYVEKVELRVVYQQPGTVYS
jgi:hypothetical protein